MDFKRQFWNRERFVIKYLEIFFLTLAAKWAAMIHSKYLKPFLLQFQYLNWNEYLECILDASNQKSSSFTPWSTFRLNWRPLIGSNQFREFSHVPVYQSAGLFGMYWYVSLCLLRSVYPQSYAHLEVIKAEY